VGRQQLPADGRSYLLMAVAALTRSERWVRQVWSWRFVTDLAVAALAVLAPAASRVVP